MLFKMLSHKSILKYTKLNGDWQRNDAKSVSTTATVLLGAVRGPQTCMDMLEMSW